MALRGETHFFAYVILKLFDLGVEELDDPPASAAHQVIVVPAYRRPLETVVIFAEAEFLQHTRRHQKLKGAINRRSGNPTASHRQALTKVFRPEVPVRPEDLVDHALPLRREWQALPPQIADKH
jgi:hypothetical protein